MFTPATVFATGLPILAQGGALAVLTLLHPAMMWAAAACAVPIAIHLLLRPRPRRQVFPAIRFLLQSHRESVRRHRLRHLLLLALRVFALLLLVLALARPILRTSWLGTGAREPTAVVICIDDSASMNYRFSGETRLLRASRIASELVRDERRFPAGSTFLVLSSSRPGNGAWSAARSAIVHEIESLSGSEGDRPLRSSIDEAFRRVAESPLPRKELYVVTDLTRHAWIGSDAGTWADRAGVGTYVIDVGHAEDRNARLTGVADLPLALPPATAQRFDCVVSAGDDAIDDRVELVVDGRAVGRSEPIRVPAGETVRASFTLPPLSPGVHGGCARLMRPDNLPADDARYFAVDVRPPPRVAVVSDRAVGDGRFDEADRVAAMLAPETLPPERRPFDVRRLTMRDLVASAAAGSSKEAAGGADALAGVDVLIVVSPRGFDDAVQRRLQAFLSASGRLIVMAGPEMDVASWSGAADVLAAVPREIVTPAGEQRVAATQPGATAGMDSALLPAMIRRYVRCQPGSGATALVRLEGGDGLAFRRSVGSGVSVMLAFGTDPEWSDLGVRAGPAIVFLHRLVQSMLPVGGRVANVACGATTGLPTVLTGGPAAGTRVERSTVAGQPPEVVTPAIDATVTPAWPTARRGVYVVRSDAQELPIAAYAVNLDPDETSGERRTAEWIGACFAPGSAVVLNDVAGLASPTVREAGDRDLLGHALILLLLVLVAEGLSANHASRAGADSQH